MGHATGSVTVEGTLKVFGSTFDGNVYVVYGGHFQAANYGSWIHGNLNITGSDNSDMNGFWSEYSDNHIDGNINLSGNQIPLYFQGQHQTLVKGSVNVLSGSGTNGDTPVQHASY